MARNFSRKSYLLPQPALYALAWTLALPLHAANKIREACAHKNSSSACRDPAYSFYDVLSPEFMHCHARREVTECSARTATRTCAFPQKPLTCGMRHENNNFDGRCP